jgi:multicomponent Na+:H+ antiporter subunit E
MGNRGTETPGNKERIFFIRQAALRIALLAFLWWILVGLDGEGWIIGIPVILSAAVVSMMLAPKLGWRFRPIKAVWFLGYFVWSALRGGIDVTSRAFHPSLPINPGFITHYFRLPKSSSRVFLADVASLLPGTLSAGLEDQCLVIHVLDCNLPVEQSMEELEIRVAALFGETLSDKKKEDRH